tara:strand:+ start:2939 stop:3358 length:420 start_codon:yes stop_codon:yes gene_type:complete
MKLLHTLDWHLGCSLLSTPKKLLRVLNVHVVGFITEALNYKLVFFHKNDQPESIICAEPYFRGKDIRTFEPGETMDYKNTKLVEGLEKHYADACGIAEQKRTKFKNIGYDGKPIAAMSHLFTSGGDGVRGFNVGLKEGK